MRESVARENARTLAAAAGIDERAAASQLDDAVLITSADDEPPSLTLTGYLKVLLDRTVTTVEISAERLPSPAVEVVIGGARPLTTGKTLRIEILPERLVIGSGLGAPAKSSHVHPIFLLLGAC